MALNVYWTRSALQDRIKVFEYWNERTQSREYSQQLNTSIEHRVAMIKEYPQAGLATDKPGVRFHIIARHYKLFYKIEKDNAYILRFWDTRQDPEKIKLHQ